jgi:predicted RNase H-like HicB family nuclease
MKKFLIIIEKTKTGFSSYSPDLIGCVATGRTKKEVEKNMYEAIKMHIEGLKSEGIDIPPAHTESELMVFA